ncbi:OmpP1/FadL family transporter [Rhodoplanes serenus]|uniref:OmpP1/FadL family transporter n=1 Tax=Rhodoplanes serenus TaxID=200615 RepID=UPI000DAF108C|nr:outer membrane protein transport protein [Rhodoplanes serenus]RAI34648.1 hypothetical protein CH340_08430 [Rhodoplanes serenus]
MTVVNYRRVQAYAGMLGLVALAAGADRAAASGFQLREQSSEGVGHAFAGQTAKAYNLSTVFYNPAGMTRLQGSQAAASISWIAPVSRFSGTNTIGGRPTSGDNGGDAIDDAPLPAMFMMWDVRPDLKLGVAVTSPFGLKTDYNVAWVGRYHALESSILNFNVSPAIAYRVNQNLSIGGAIQLGYTEVTLSQAINLGRLPDGKVELNGSDLGVGFDIGMLYEFSQHTRVGVNWRSHMDYTLKGSATYDLPVGLPAQVIAANRLYVSNAKADLTTPDTVSVGLYHELSPKWAVMSDIQWTRWSTFKELRVKYNDGRPDTLTPENWKDTWFFSLGATYHLSERQSLQFGVAYDQAPVDDTTRKARIPDANRYWLAAGYSFTVSPRYKLNLGYAHIFADNAKIYEVGAPTVGILQGEYKSSVDIFSASLEMKF